MAFANKIGIGRCRKRGTKGTLWGSHVIDILALKSLVRIPEIDWLCHAAVEKHSE